MPQRIDPNESNETVSAAMHLGKAIDVDAVVEKLPKAPFKPKVNVERMRRFL